MFLNRNKLIAMVLGLACGLFTVDAFGGIFTNGCNTTAAATACVANVTVNLPVFGACTTDGNGTHHNCNAWGIICGASGSCDCWCAGWLLNQPTGCI